MSLSKGYRPWSRVVDSELRIVPITFFDVATELIELGPRECGQFSKPGWYQEA